jgi:DNA-binding GntR family transcriptional regulator
MQAQQRTSTTQPAAKANSKAAKAKAAAFAPPLQAGGKLAQALEGPNKGLSKKQPSAAAAKALDHLSGTEGPRLNTPEAFSKQFVRLSVQQLPKQGLDYTQTKASKDLQIAEFLTAWLEDGLANGTLHAGLLLPLKQELAPYFGVSMGTVQNAIRHVEDAGLVESKQRVGTLIKAAPTQASRVRKLTSKRDRAVVALEHYLLQKSLPLGTALPPSRELAKAIGAAPNTTRLALEYLTHQGLLQSEGTRGKGAHWYLNRQPNADTQHKPLEAVGSSNTLIDQLERDLKAMIVAEFATVGAKLPSHQELAQRFTVSIKTVHDAMQRLMLQGYVQAKRGRYGTFVLRLPTQLLQPSLVEGLFVPAAEQTLPSAGEPTLAPYAYQAAEDKLGELLSSRYQSGQKLPSMELLAQQLGLSSGSVRRGLQALAASGKLELKRGRNGGAVVV